MQTTRRNFIKMVALPMVVAPFILPSRVWAAPPSGRVTMGLVGMGRQSRGLLLQFMSRAQVLAVCDVDTTRRTHAQQTVDKFNADTPDKVVAGCKAYNDYRELMERKDIDTVCIATPDHWHAAPTLLALKKGKDVYCEKPLTHNIREAIEVIKAVDEHNRVLQTGSMQRSMKEFRVACELVRNGCIGKINRVECTMGAPAKPCTCKEEAMEPGLNWNLWLGPAPLRPYSSVLSPRGVHETWPGWRGFREYGTGYLGDIGAHQLDIAQWGLGMDDSGPVEVRFTGQEATLVYASGATVIHKGNARVDFGVHFYGSDGEVEVNRGRFQVIIKGQTMAEFLWEKTKGTSCEAEVQKAERTLLKDARINLYESKSHPDDFLACVESRAKPVANEQVGGRTAICVHLMNQLYFHNAAMKWDPAKLCFADGTGNPAWLTRDYRDWTKAQQAGTVETRNDHP